MSARLKRVLEEAAALPEAQQERLADTLLAELVRLRETPPPRAEPFVVRSKSLGIRPGITPDELDAIAWGDERLLGYATTEG